jgi:uncharacterized protein (DUF849 family)
VWVTDKLVIEVRINEYTMRDGNPHVPYSPEEIASQAVQCWREGASIVHFHARDPRTGAPSCDAGLYADITRRIRAESDLLLMPTNVPENGVLTLDSDEARIAPILAIAADPATRPELGPIDLTTTNLDFYDRAARRYTTTDRIYANTTASWQLFARSFTSAGVKPVPLLWTVGSIRALQAHVEMGFFADPLWCEIVLTDGALLIGHPGTVRGLQAFLDFFPPEARWHWSVFCFGGNVFAAAAAAIERSGHVSIGLGDYHYQELGLPTNAELVRRVVALARDMGREIATPREVRTLLGV